MTGWRRRVPRRTAPAGCGRASRPKAGCRWAYQKRAAVPPVVEVEEKPTRSRLRTARKAERDLRKSLKLKIRARIARRRGR